MTKPCGLSPFEFRGSKKVRPRLFVQPYVRVGKRHVLGGERCGPVGGGGGGGAEEMNATS
jgi:hypothetical protein